MMATATPAHTDSTASIDAAVRAVPDPEIPVLTIEDLGILRAVEITPAGEAAPAADAMPASGNLPSGRNRSDGDGLPAGETGNAAGPRVHVVITPTYSGCPAMETITADVHRAATAAGAAEVEVELVFSPAWTTDWMSEEGKAKLNEYGIAPPTGKAAAGPIGLSLAVKCPHCHSLNTHELARFGSTACKALYRCSDCLEPFDYFKVH